ncbi:MAG: DNA-binding response regulator [Nitrospirota bacterium]
MENAGHNVGPILVIDRCGATGEVLEKTFGSSYRLLLAASAAEGLRMLSPDVRLVILDLTLPDRDGIEVLEGIKREYPSIPVIVTTPCGTEELCMRAYQAGARDYIRKPFTAEELLMAIEALLTIGIDSQKRKHIPVTPAPAKSERAPSIPPHILRGVIRVKEFIENNYAASLDLPGACRLSSINRTYFCRYFKLLTGHSLKSYQNHIKVRKALELLLELDLSVTDIARMVGYDDANYFSTIFKKITGASPRHRKPSP